VISFGDERSASDLAHWLEQQGFHSCFYLTGHGAKNMYGDLKKVGAIHPLDLNQGPTSPHVPNPNFNTKPTLILRPRQNSALSSTTCSPRQAAPAPPPSPSSTAATLTTRSYRTWRTSLGMSPFILTSSHASGCSATPTADLTRARRLASSTPCASTRPVTR